jgi:hypothetical protein
MHALKTAYRTPDWASSGHAVEEGMFGAFRTRSKLKRILYFNSAPRQYSQAEKSHYRPRFEPQSCYS